MPLLCHPTQARPGADTRRTHTRAPTRRAVASAPSRRELTSGTTGQATMKLLFDLSALSPPNATDGIRPATSASNHSAIRAEFNAKFHID